MSKDQQPNPTSIPCPQCGVQAGEECISSDKLRTMSTPSGKWVHMKRALKFTEKKR